MFNRFCLDLYNNRYQKDKITDLHSKRVFRSSLSETILSLPFVTSRFALHRDIRSKDGFRILNFLVGPDREVPGGRRR